MDIDTLKKLLCSDKVPHITVFGDYCLDKYLYIDPALDEPSVETGLTAYQVTRTKCYPGAAGTITNNLRALGADVTCVGIIGRDGEGYELETCLRDIGADVSRMVHTDKRQTCTYIKPMRGLKDRETELNRIDMRNFTATPADVEDALIENLRAAAQESDAVIICDQYVESDMAAVTERVRRAIGEMADNGLWYADSRGHIDLFSNVMVKCNHREIAAIFGADPDRMDVDGIAGLATRLYDKNRKPVIVTLGEKGCVAFDGTPHYAPAFRVDGQVDICGAGDAYNAGMIFALTKGIPLAAAAVVGNACSSIVIKQIGVTGTATVAEVIQKLDTCNI